MYDWSTEEFQWRNFLHYHANRIFRATKKKLHWFPNGVTPDEDEAAVERSQLLMSNPAQKAALRRKYNAHNKGK